MIELSLSGGKINMKSIENIEFNVCEDIKCVEVDVKIENEGHLLKVPVYLDDVCPSRKIIVGVRIYVKGKLYAMKTKKVFTGGRPYCRKIREFYVDDFHFLFTDTCIDDIDVDVLAHYIC